MMRPLVCIIGLVLIESPALAQQMPCDDKDKVIAELTGERYGEVGWLALSVDGTETGTLTLYSNFRTGTWTILGNPKPNVACIVAGGKSLKILTPPKQGKPL